MFCSERYGLKGEDGHKGGATSRHDIRPEVPIGSWKVSWTPATRINISISSVGAAGIYVEAHTPSPLRGTSCIGGTLR